jgi:2'-5' RNA ligase
MRAFVALDPDDDARARLVALIDRGKLRVDVPKASFTKPEKLHLTLRFLGEIDDAMVARIAAGLPAACEGMPAPHAHFSGVSGFPDVHAARSVFAAIGDDDGVRHLAGAVERVLRTFDVPPDPRELVPHVTLARCRHPADVATWAAALGEGLGAVWFPRCTLYETRGLAEGGSAYVPIVSVVLVEARNPEQETLYGRGRR